MILVPKQTKLQTLLFVAISLLVSSSPVVASKDADNRKQPSKIVCSNLRKGAGEDQVRVISSAKNIARFEVIHKRGIGGMQIDFASKYKPVLLEFELLGFGNLENFTISYGKQKLSSNLKQSPISWESSISEKGQNVEKESEQKIRIKGRQKHGLLVSFEIGQILRNTEHLTVSWIDAYR